MRALVVLLCAACNNLLGLDTTSEKLVDAPPAPPTCQPLPAFRSSATPLSAGRSDYTSDPHELSLAVAWNPSTMKIQEAMPGQDDFVDAVINDTGLHANSSPRLAPSADALFVRDPAPIQAGVEFRVFARGGNEWTAPQTLVIDQTAVLVNPDDVISTPSAGAVQRHIVLAHGPAPHTFFEMSESSPAWKTVKPPYPASTFNLDDIEDPYLTPDTLAVIFVGTQQGMRGIYIIVRDRIRPFEAADVHLLYQPPVAVELHTPFVNADCSRLYYSTADGVYYVTP